MEIQCLDLNHQDGRFRFMSLATLPQILFGYLISIDRGCIFLLPPLYNLPSGHVLVYSLNCYIMERNSYRPRSGCNYDALIWIIKTNAIHTRDVSHNPTTHLNPLHLVDGCISFSPPSDHLPSDHVLVHPLNCYRILFSHSDYKFNAWI